MTCGILINRRNSCPAGACSSNSHAYAGSRLLSCISPGFRVAASRSISARNCGEISQLPHSAHHRCKAARSRQRLRFATACRSVALLHAGDATAALPLSRQLSVGERGCERRRGEAARWLAGESESAGSAKLTCCRGGGGDDDDTVVCGVAGCDTGWLERPDGCRPGLSCRASAASTSGGISHCETSASVL